MQLPNAPAILVSLPRNDRALAEAAKSAGAYGLKVHVNVTHRASGTAFGCVEEEASRLLEVLDIGLPTGLVVGGGTRVLASEMRAAQQMGFDYFDVYAYDAPVDYVELCGDVTPVAAIGPGDGRDQASALVGLGVLALEMSTLHPDLYGTPLSLATLARLTQVAGAVQVPVIVPSQHRLIPSDIGPLLTAGAAAILLGTVVTGNEPEQIESAVRAFVTTAANVGNARPSGTCQAR